jgi:hypothetical protein
MGGAVGFHAQLGQTGVKTDLVDQTARYRDCELRQLFEWIAVAYSGGQNPESRFLGFFPCLLLWVSSTMTIRCICSPYGRSAFLTCHTLI